jgi:hypothetical protein
MIEIEIGGYLCIALIIGEVLAFLCVFLKVVSNHQVPPAKPKAVNPHDLACGKYN